MIRCGKGCAALALDAPDMRKAARNSEQASYRPAGRNRRCKPMDADFRRIHPRESAFIGGFIIHASSRRNLTDLCYQAENLSLFGNKFEGGNSRPRARARQRNTCT